MWMIVGLGNPGKAYANTRHNVGFMVAEEIAERYRIPLTEKKDGYRIGKGSIESERVILVEPLRYMNLSGPVVQTIREKFAVPPERLIVVHDDLDMETGRLRIRRTGSSGGHKGVESIIHHLGSKDFIRVKIGIGRTPGVNAEEYVLSRFKQDEKKIIMEAVKRAADSVRVIIAEGLERAMNTFNA